MNSTKAINADLAGRYNLIADIATLHGITEEGECPITAITVMLKNRHREQERINAIIAEVGGAFELVTQCDTGDPRDLMVELIDDIERIATGKEI